MSLGLLLQRRAVQESAFSASSFNEVVTRMESAFSSLQRASNILRSACNHRLNEEQSKLGHFQLSLIPLEFQPTTMRVESYERTSMGLKFRAEGIISSITDSIVNFFKWIGQAFKKLFGGGDSETTAAAGAAAATATAEVCAAANQAGLDEFLFKENSPLFRSLDLNDLERCKKFVQAIASSSHTLVEMNKKAIELSKSANKEYKGEFNRDAVQGMKEFAGKTDSYTKEIVGDQQGSFYAYPVSFLKAKIIVFGDNEITLPSDADAKSGKGYNPKDVYIPVSKWKNLVDSYVDSSKSFFDAGEKLKALSDEYKSLETRVKEWTHMEPEEARLVGEGIKQLNRVASFVYNAVKAQEDHMRQMSATLKNVSENDLRKQAKEGRNKDKEEAEAKAKAEQAAKNQGNQPAPAAP